MRIATVNPNCADRLVEELRYGTDLPARNILLVQETKLQGEDRERFEKWGHRHGWDAITDDAYTKSTKAGGGTAVMMKNDGLRRVIDVDTEFIGRLTVAIAAIAGGITFVSIYGVSGGHAASQRRLWRHLVELVALLGLPFITGGTGR